MSTYTGAIQHYQLGACEAGGSAFEWNVTGVETDGATRSSPSNGCSGSTGNRIVAKYFTSGAPKLHGIDAFPIQNR